MTRAKNQRLLTVLSFLWAVAVAPAEETAALSQRLQVIEQELETLPKLIPSPETQQRLGFHGLQADPAWVAIDFGRTVTPEQVVIFPARVPAPGDVPSPGFPARLKVEISANDDFAASVRIGDWTETEPGAGERVPFLSFHGNGASGRYLRVRVTAFRNDPLRSGQPHFRLGEIVVLEGGQNVALNCPVTSTAAIVVSRSWEPRNLTDGYFWCLPLRGRESSTTNGYQSTMRRHPEVNGAAWVEVDLGAASPIDEIHLVPAHPKDFADLPGYGFPTHFRVLADAGTADEKELLSEVSPPYPGEALPNPGEAQLMFATPGLLARRIRITCEALWRRGPASGQNPSEYVFAMSELQCWHGGRNLAAGCTVRSSDAGTEPGWSPEALTDGHSSRHELLDWATWLDGIEKSESLRAEARSIRSALDKHREITERRTLTLAIASAIVIALLAIAALLVQRARAKRHQDDLRTRIARDLHDEIGASLSHLAMQGDLARQQLQRAELTSERLETISASARETLDQMRDIIWLLAPKSGDWRELSHRLEAIARRLLDGVEHQVTASGEPPGGHPPIGWARDAVAFLKETLTNARKHGHASAVRVRIEWGENLILSIEDDGRGFDLKGAQQGSGIGLENLRLRAAALNATCEIRSAAQEGTSIRLVAPIVQR